MNCIIHITYSLTSLVLAHASETNALNNNHHGQHLEHLVHDATNANRNSVNQRV